MSSVHRTLYEILELAGFHVMVAYDGWEGLEQAAGFHPDYLPSDVLMDATNEWRRVGHCHPEDISSRKNTALLGTGGDIKHPFGGAKARL